MATDYWLTVYHYSYPFHIRGYLITWAWYAGIALLGSSLLRNSTALRVVAGVLTSATSFFLLSNFAVWPGSHMYSQDLRGLLDCLYAGLPFYRNDLISTSFFAIIFFGWKPATEWVIDIVQSSNQTTA